MINKITLVLAALFISTSVFAQNLFTANGQLVNKNKILVPHSTGAGNEQVNLGCNCMPAVHSVSDLVLADTVTCSDWTGNDWDYDTKIVTTYDLNGNILTETKSHWNPIWVNDTLKTYTYNGNGDIITFLKQYWTGSVWRNDRKITYSYDGNANLTNVLKQWWTGTIWKNLWQFTYTYDGNNNQLTNSYQTWNQGNSVWDNEIQYQYAYDGNNFLITETILDGNLTTWQNQSLNTYTNNGSGKPLIIILQQWNGSQYANANRTTFVYNGNGQTTNRTGYSWIGGSWDNDYQENAVYDGNGNLLEFTELSGNGPGWINSYKDTYTYDGNNNWETNMFQIWNGNDWDNNMMQYAMWDGNNQTYFAVAFWDGTNWAPNYEFSYGYDVNGRLRSSLNRQWSNNTLENVRACNYGYDAIITGISDVEETQADVYPNPFHNSVTFESNIGSKQVQLYLYDYSGKLLKNVIVTQRYILDRANMASGIYFYKLVSVEGVIASGKLVAE